MYLNNHNNHITDVSFTDVPKNMKIKACICIRFLVNLGHHKNYKSALGLRPFHYILNQL